MGKKLIPAEAIPDKESQVVQIEGKDYLVMNDAMYTFFRRSMGEFSPFFLGLRDDKKILGCRCTVCGIVRVPPFLTRCPDCGFAPTEPVEVGDVGKMLSTPPITYFATSLFQQQVPFGRGRVVLQGADTALSVNVYTTRGILVPGVITKDTEVKVVFRDERVGEITDIFCVPVSELTHAQVAKQGLLDSELDWESAHEPPVGPATDADRRGFQAALEQLRTLSTEMNDLERVRQDIANWERKIQVKSRGGTLVMSIHEARLEIVEGSIDSPDFVMVSEDAGTLSKCLAYHGSLTQAIMTRDLWISKNGEFTTIVKLERMARSLARSKKS